MAKSQIWLRIVKTAPKHPGDKRAGRSAIGPIQVIRDGEVIGDLTCTSVSFEYPLDGLARAVLSTPTFEEVEGITVDAADAAVLSALREMANE